MKALLLLSALALVAATACFLELFNSTVKEPVGGRRRKAVVTKKNGFGLGLLPRAKRPFLFPFLDKQWCNVFDSWRGCLCKEEQLRQAIKDAADNTTTTIHVCFDTYIATRGTPINVDNKSLNILCDRYTLLMGSFDWHVHCKLKGLFTNQVFVGAPVSMHFENFKFADSVTPVANSNGDGGVVSFRSGDVSFTECAFEGNKARWNGGAIAMTGGGSLILNNVQFIHNSADTGGAVYVANDVQVTANNTVFEANIAHQNGGAIAIHQSKVALVDSTFHKNDALENGNDIYILDPGVDDLDRALPITESFVRCETTFEGSTTFCGGLTGSILKAPAVTPDGQLKNDDTATYTDCVANGATEGPMCDSLWTVPND